MQHIQSTSHLRRVFISAILIALFTVATSSTTFAGQKMPEKLKAEFTQYPGSKVYQTVTAEGTIQAILDCGNESPSAVFDYYKKKAAENGWKIQMENKTEEVYTLMLQKKNQNAMINISIEDGETIVVLSLFGK